MRVHLTLATTIKSVIAPNNKLQYGLWLILVEISSDN